MTTPRCEQRSIATTCCDQRTRTCGLDITSLSNYGAIPSLPLILNSVTPTIEGYKKTSLSYSGTEIREQNKMKKISSQPGVQKKIYIYDMKLYSFLG